MKPQLHPQLITHTIYNEIWTGHIAYITQPQEFGWIDEDKNNKYTKSVIKVTDSLIIKGNFEGNMGILILGLCPANERWRYKGTSLIGWSQPRISPVNW